MLANIANFDLGLFSVLWKRFRNSSFLQRQHNTKHVVFRALLRSMGGPTWGQQVMFVTSKFHGIQTVACLKSWQQRLFYSVFASWFLERHVNCWSKNGQHSTPTKLLPEMLKGQTCQHFVRPWALCPPYHEKIGGSPGRAQEVKFRSRTSYVWVVSLTSIVVFKTD